MLTLAELETRTYGNMGMSSDSSVFDSSTVVRPRIASVYQDVCGGQIADVLKAQTTYVAPPLRPLAKQVFLSVPAPTTSSAAVAAGDTSFPVSDSSAFPASGAIFCQGEVLTYTANVANVLTLSSPAASAHESGCAVSAAFAVPADFSKPVDAMQSDDGSIYEYVDDRAEKPAGTRWYTVKPGTGTTGDYFWFPGGGIRVRVTYVMAPPALEFSLDASVLSDAQDQDIVCSIAAGSLLFEKYGDDPLGQRGATLLRNGYAALVSFYSRNAIKVKKFRNTVKRPFWRPIPSTR